MRTTRRKAPAPADPYLRFLEAVRPALEAPLCPTTGGLVCFFCGAWAPAEAEAFAHIPACAVERWRELDLRTSA